MKNRKIPTPFIFNLGRIWQSALRDDWPEAGRICGLIEQTGITDAGLKRIKTAVIKEDINGLDESLNKVLDW